MRYSLHFRGKGTLEAEQRVRVGVGSFPHPPPSCPLATPSALKGEGYRWYRVVV